MNLDLPSRNCTVEFMMDPIALLLLCKVNKRHTVICPV